MKYLEPPPGSTPSHATELVLPLPVANSRGSQQAMTPAPSAPAARRPPPPATERLPDLSTTRPVPPVDEAARTLPPEPLTESPTSPWPGEQAGASDGGAPRVKRKRRWTPAAAIGIGILVGVGGGAPVLFALAKVTAKSDVTVNVGNLAAGERYYLFGLRVDGDPVTLKKGTPVPLAIGSGGALVRFGTVDAASQLDATAVPQVKVPPGARAELNVESDPMGCGVTLSGGNGKGVTPWKISIPAGSETQVDISCPGLPRHTQWVLAAPDQRISVVARLFNARK